MPTPEEVTDRLTELRAIGPFEPLQIVPTFDDHELLSHPAANASGVLNYHGGRTLPTPKVALVIVDAFDGSPADLADYQAFVQAIVEGGYYVSPDGTDTTNGTFLGTFHVQSGLSGTVDDSQLQAMLAPHLGTDLPAPALDTIFLVATPATMTVTFQTAAQCTQFCGYHGRFDNTYYAIICAPDCNGCTGTVTAAAARQMVTGHEYGEIRSDPDGDGWWEDATGMENGDKCAWQPVKWGPSSQWTVQPLWVNGQGCAEVPPYRAPSGPAPLMVSLNASPASAQTGQSVSFSASASGGTSPFSYRLNFGDGSAPAGVASTSHVYSTAGSYRATVTASDAAGKTASASAAVSVSAPQPQGCQPIVDATFAALAAAITAVETPETAWWYDAIKGVLVWAQNAIDGALA